MKRINVGIIGGGFMCKAHVNGYRTAEYIFPELGARAALEAVCVRSMDKAMAIKDRYGFANAYANMDEFIENPNVDLYDVCVPSEFHRQIAMKVISTGKAVLCEKPLALRAADAKEMLIAARAYGADNYAGFNYRFLPAVTLAKKLITEGTLGKPRHMRASYFQQGGADADRPLDEIRYARTPGSGSLQEIGTHAIDQMRYLIGEFDSLSAIATTFTAKRRRASGEWADVVNDDAAAAIVRFDNGATGALECSGAYWGKRNQLSWEIFLSDGSLSWSLENPNYLGVYKKGAPAYVDGVSMVSVTGAGYPYGENWWPGGHNLGWEHGQANMIAGILENMATGERVKPVATFLDGYRAAVIVDAIRESSRTGERINLRNWFEM